MSLIASTPGELRTATATSSIEVLPLSPTEWRVRDTTLPDSDGRSVLGLVQQIGDTYEVLRIGMPLSRFYFGTLDDGVRFLATR